MSSVTEVIDSGSLNTSKTHMWNSEFLNRHNLLGHVYKRTQNKTYYPYWKSQMNRNSFAKNELERIGQDIQREGVQVYLLKGYSLMGEVYQDWGERYVSDIDMLVSYDELWKLTDIFKMYGYTKKKEPKWLGNRHKHIYCKKTEDLTLTIEVSTQLFWHTSLKISEDSLESQVPGFKKLSHENQLIHLCGAVACQNAYSKLFWLMDIYKFTDLYKKKIDWDLFWKSAEQAGLYKACYFTLFLCQKLGLNIQLVLYRLPKKKKIGIYLLKKLVNFSYLYNPERYPQRKFLIQLLIKDSMMDNLRYAYASAKVMRAGEATKG